LDMKHMKNPEQIEVNERQKSEQVEINNVESRTEYHCSLFGSIAEKHALRYRTQLHFQQRATMMRFLFTVALMAPYGHCFFALVVVLALASMCASRPFVFAESLLSTTSTAADDDTVVRDERVERHRNQ